VAACRQSGASCVLAVVGWDGRPRETFQAGTPGTLSGQDYHFASRLSTTGGGVACDGAKLIFVALAVGLRPLGVHETLLVGQASPGLAHRPADVLPSIPKRSGAERLRC